MAPMFFLQFLSNPLSNMFIVAQKQKVGMFLQAFLFAGVLSALLVGNYVFDDAKISILLFSIAYSVKYLMDLLLSYRYSLGKQD